MYVSEDRQRTLNLASSLRHMYRNDGLRFVFVGAYLPEYTVPFQNHRNKSANTHILASVN